MDRLAFRPLQWRGGYLPIEDYGLIGDGQTCALVGRDGTVAWLCAPRFDSPALFCSILDRHRGGAFRIFPEDFRESRHSYEPDTGVLVTELRAPSGLVRITDALTLRTGADLGEDARADRGELLRQVEVLEGAVDLRVEVDPRGGARAQSRGGGLRVIVDPRQDLDLQLTTSHPMDGLRARFSVAAGARMHFALGWSGEHYRHQPHDPEQRLEATRRAWQSWAAHIAYDGPQRELVRRSAITLKLLDHFASGAILAAPTSSLPEAIGGVRNWDYRFAWIRDAAFSVYALRRVGLPSEADAFLGWVLDVSERHARPKVLYDLSGRACAPEQEDPALEGYRGSAPVRWGNAASEQRQHDVYGEILDCAYQWARHGGAIDRPLWERLSAMVEAARAEWNTPDHGIWEVRSSGRPFTYSAALCHVALDRGLRLAEQFRLPADAEGWRREAERIRQAILEVAWDESAGALRESLGSGKLDASILTLPLRRVLPADHPRMVATTEAVARELGAGGGLLYRYRPHLSPDGLPGEEGAFLLCSFWWVDNLTLQGRIEEALAQYESLCSRANALGLLPEQIDPEDGSFLGNFPQAFSHVGVISSGVTLARALRREGR